MGPDFASFVELIYDLSTAMTIDLGNFISLREGGYWLVLNI
jgi:hypothetical protein